MLLFHTGDAVLVLGGYSIIILHLFYFASDSLFVLLLETHDLGGLFLSLLDLLPSLHLLLLEQGNTVSQ